jgi:hypothetical protein
MQQFLGGHFSILLHFIRLGRKPRAFSGSPGSYTA